MMSVGNELGSSLIFFVNGHRIVESNPDPETTLVFYLRNNLRLCGTKVGCSEGGCGACTVMVSRFDKTTETPVHCAINACLAPLCSLHGVAVTTVEGIGSTRTKLHDIQERLAKSHGTQCGFCTPGFVMSMYALLRTIPQPTGQDMETAFQGNLCRCTGYRPILEGFRSFVTDKCCSRGEQCCMKVKEKVMQVKGCSRTQNCGRGNTCCRQNGASVGCITNGSASGQKTEEESPTTNGVNYHPAEESQEPIFPSELQLKAKEFDSTPLMFKSDRVTWYRPTQLTDLLQLKEKYPTAKLIVGNTEIGVELKLKNALYPVLIAATHITELNSVEVTNVSIRFGASVTLTTVENTLKQAVRKLKESQTRVLVAIVEMLRWFAGPQIRNTAAIGGNIINASPISDLNPLLMAAGCTLTLVSHGEGRRKVKIDERFFTGYRQTLLKPTEILLYVDIPLTTEDEYFAGYKQAPRREDDISIVNAGMRVELEQGQTTIKDIALAFGGMAPTTVMATKTARQLVGRQWNDELVPFATKLLLEEMPLPAGCPGGMEAYRCSLAVSFFFKFYLTVRLRLEQTMPSVYTDTMPENYRSACEAYERPPSSGVQLYEQVGEDQLHVDAVGRPLPHLSAQKHTTGEAVYIDDMPSFRDELHLSLVLSTKAHARLLNVDPTDALLMPGVVDFVSHKDVRGSNSYGEVVKDEEIFATDKVTCQGHVIGAIIAQSKVEAQRAAKAVKVSYEELKPIITIEQAIAANSFLHEALIINKGDTDEALAAADHVLERSFHMGGQEHFYMETQSSIAVPKGEDGEMEVFIASQTTMLGQEDVARALGVDYNKITCRVKRIGGGFGGKESRWALVALPTAIAANKLNRPVRGVLDRDVDMAITGTRHPFLANYKVGFGKNGRICALDLQVFSNGGNSLDMSEAVMEHAIFHCDNCYNIPNFRVVGRSCRTNLPSNTAFRGFGVPQAVIICENIVDHIASFLNANPLQIRELNFYAEGDSTHYNQRITDMTLDRCWKQVIELSHFEKRKQNVDKFNGANRWKKRGICVTPIKHAVGFGIDFLNQAGALVHVYVDGSVSLSHCAVEMGQGIHTKMVQVASRVLKIPTSYIYISESSSSLVPNASPTAASMSSDLNGMAVINACQTLMDRLQPYIDSNPSGEWKDWVSKAYFDRVSLSATGFYRTPAVTYDPALNVGNKYQYFTFGAACSEVEIDCLTGDHTVLRTDIVMDVGKSLNPAIDVGQIEGAFMQGYGLYVLEEHKYMPDGFLLTRGPGTYKIPSCSNIPVEFNVTLLKDSTNTKAVYSSNAIGEPPLLLATSVFFAIKSAIMSARKEAGLSGPFRLDSPATPERIRMACVDHITQQVPSYSEGTFKPWNIRI